MKLIKKIKNMFGFDNNNQKKHSKNVNPKNANHKAHEHTSPIYHNGTISSQGHGTLGHSNNTRNKNNPNKTRSKGNGNK